MGFALQHLEAWYLSFNSIPKKHALPWALSAAITAYMLLVRLLPWLFFYVVVQFQVVGDQEGAVFGGLVEAPLSPTSKKKYQGTCNSFVFTDVSGSPVVFRPTGANRYFTLCSTEFIAFGGGGHFALYLDGDLLSGSSSASETFGNSCLSHTTEFDVKEVELWGFTYVSKYGGAPFHPVEASSICRW